MPLPVALSLVDVTVRYGDRVAVSGVSLDVRRGEIVGLLGPNGSGKSSTLAVAAGVIDPVSGSVTVEGARPPPIRERSRRAWGWCPKSRPFTTNSPPSKTSRSSVNSTASPGATCARRAIRALSRLKLSDRAHHRVSTFSGGLKQRLNLAAALLHDPPVLLLDEPTASLDPASRDSLFADLTRFRDDGHAILLTTHHIDEAESGCDRVAVLEKGKLIACGVLTELLGPQPAERGCAVRPPSDAPAEVPRTRHPPPTRTQSATGNHRPPAPAFGGNE